MPNRAVHLRAAFCAVWRNRVVRRRGLLRPLQAIISIDAIPTHLFLIRLYCHKIRNSRVVFPIERVKWIVPQEVNDDVGINKDHHDRL